jgi:murein DD-endopeptidase MepM/ murein hydrolase activator NlpD
MKEKNYRFIILNNQTSFNKSFSFNKTQILSIYFLLLIITIIFAFGVLKIIKPHPKQTEFNIIKNHQINAMDFIHNMNNEDSTNLKDYKIHDYYIESISMIPNHMPVKGIVTRGIIENQKYEHNGIDIAAKFNSSVFPAQEGLVILSDNLPHLDKTIIISHPNNYYSLYSHLNQVFVKPLEYVNIKTKIGTVGKSKESEGPHLHFEIWQNSNIIDPRSIIKEYKINDVSIKKNK